MGKDQYLMRLKNKLATGKKLILAMLLVLTLNGCHVAFFVSKYNVIWKQQGYIVIVSYDQYVEFIPSKIDTALSIQENLEKYKLGKAFYLYGLNKKELNYLKIFADTFSLGSIIPVAFEYRINKQATWEKKQSKNGYHQHSIKLSDKIYRYKITTRNIDYINSSPLLSKARQREKTKNIEN